MDKLKEMSETQVKKKQTTGKQEVTGRPLRQIMRLKTPKRNEITWRLQRSDIHVREVVEGNSRMQKRQYSKRQCLRIFQNFQKP